MKINKKVIMIFILGIIVLTVIMPISYGLGVGDMTGTTKGTDGLATSGQKLVGIITIIGTIVSVVALIALGIKYVMGSVEERAEYKKSLLPYFIGAILLFAASTIAHAIYAWATTI